MTKEKLQLGFRAKKNLKKFKIILYRSLGRPGSPCPWYLLYHTIKNVDRTSGPPKDRYKVILIFQIFFGSKAQLYFFWSSTTQYNLSASGALTTSSASTHRPAFTELKLSS